MDRRSFDLDVKFILPGHQGTGTKTQNLYGGVKMCFTECKLVVKTLFIAALLQNIK